MPASRTNRSRQPIETPVLLSRPLNRHPGTDWCLLLQGPDGAITGGFHQGRQLDAAQAVALQSAHRWQEAGAISPSFE
jgi:hypothetical protein